MRSWVALAVVALLGIVTTTGLAVRGAESEQSLAALILEEQLRQQVDLLPLDPEQLAAVRPQLDHYLSTQVATSTAIVVVDPEPAVRPATVIPALAMLAAAVLVVRWVDRRRRPG